MYSQVLCLRQKQQEWMGDLFNHGIYDMHIQIKSVLKFKITHSSPKHLENITDHFPQRCQTQILKTFQSFEFLKIWISKFRTFPEIQRPHRKPENTNFKYLNTFLTLIM